MTNNDVFVTYTIITNGYIFLHVILQVRLTLRVNVNGQTRLYFIQSVIET